MPKPIESPGTDEHPRRPPHRRQPRGLRGHRWQVGVALLASWLLLLAVLGFAPPLLDIDSGPYVSMAHHLLDDGRAVSSFGFAGGFEHLPSPPGFAPPGLSALLALAAPLSPPGETPAATWRLAGRSALFACLLAAHVFAFAFLRRATRAPWLALSGAILIVWSPAFSMWATLVLTELPFLTCLLAALAAALAVLEPRPAGDGNGPASRRRAAWTGLAWTGLVAASALLPLIRYLGVFFAPVFVAVYLFTRRPSTGRGSPGRKLGAAALYAALSSMPLALWVGWVEAGGSTLFPARPPSRLGLGAALGDAAGALAGWLGLWLVGGIALLLWRPGSRAPRRKRGRKAKTEESSAAALPAVQRPALLLLGGCLLAYLGLLILLRTRSAYYPLDELGLRYLAPAWPLAALLTAVLGHRLLSRPDPSRRLTAVLLVTALLQLGWYAREHSRREPTPLFPTYTATYQALLERAGPEDGVLMTFGQAYAIDRPRARVVGIPSRLDFDYRLDVPALAREHDLEWLVLFAVPGGEAMYGEWYERWMQAPPRELPLAGAWRISRPDGGIDGVIFRLDTD